VRYWDSSAIIPLLLEEPQTAAVQKLYEQDSHLVVWSLTELEIASALARRVREGFEARALERARRELSKLVDRWGEISTLLPVRARALRLINTHAIRAADAMQLAAALVASDERPESLPFVSLDDHLSEAARKEGFPVLPS
jgi:predicted nucleic acid-binding protein